VKFSRDVEKLPRMTYLSLFIDKSICEFV